MRILILFCILVTSFLTYTVTQPNLGTAFVIHTFAQRFRTATAGDIVVGKVEKSSGNIVSINWTPCKEVKKIVVFSKNFKVEKLGQRRCNNGKIYDAVRVIQE